MISTQHPALASMSFNPIQAPAPVRVPAMTAEVAAPASLDSFVPTQAGSPVEKIVISAAAGAYGFVAASAVLPAVAGALSGPWGAAGAHLALSGVGAAVGWAVASKDAHGEATSTGRRAMGAVIGATATAAATVSGGAPVISRLVLGAVGGALYGVTHRS